MWLDWLFSRKQPEENEMPEIKDVVTDDMVKGALQSDAVSAAVKVQIHADLDPQIDSAVDAALADVLNEDVEPTA